MGDGSAAHPQSFSEPMPVSVGPSVPVAVPVPVPEGVRYETAVGNGGGLPLTLPTFGETAATPNGQKIHIMLEETGLPYNEHWIDIDKGEQFDPAFLAISPRVRGTQGA